MITLGRRGDLHARRQATAFLRSRDVVHKLFAEVGPRFKDRPGGYARIIKHRPASGRRSRDGVPRARRRGVRRDAARGADACTGACAAVPVEAAEEAPETEEEAVEDPEAAAEVDAESEARRRS